MEETRRPVWADTPEEAAVMHVLTVLVPRVLAPVAEAALSPLMGRVDRALDIAETLAKTLATAVESGHELMGVARDVRADLKRLSELIEHRHEIHDAV